MKGIKLLSSTGSAMNLVSRPSLYVCVCVSQNSLGATGAHPSLDAGTSQLLDRARAPACLCCTRSARLGARPLVARSSVPPVALSRAGPPHPYWLRCLVLYLCGALYSSGIVTGARGVQVLTAVPRATWSHAKGQQTARQAQCGAAGQCY